MSRSSQATGATWSRCRAWVRLRDGALGLLALALAFGGCGTGAQVPRGWDHVLDPEYVHYGSSYAAWSARWWQWFLELPGTDHPAFDPTGADAWQNQVDPVWFLCGIMGTTYEPTDGSVERWVTLPAGTALFFPIINVELDNAFCVEPGRPEQSRTELRLRAYDIVNAVEDVYCVVDGDRIIDSPDLSGAVRFRAMAHEFTALMPEDNLAITLCDAPAGPIVVDPVASDGIWMMLAPMPPGEHTIRFGGSFPSFDFHLDVVYHVTVVP